MPMMEMRAVMKSSDQRLEGLSVTEPGEIGRWGPLVEAVGGYIYNVSVGSCISIGFWNSACRVVLHRPGKGKLYVADQLCCGAGSTTWNGKIF